ncbi:uncharacterized protein LOC133833011 [Humulus lupulus]|uniref:uncharacterized protein LOC133833011 n=1 Tax=Humulus lupulus TaxID=3486 RepID=UPI002B40BBA7|nr:uncharacterized protein LOC133833011 [Humulus lupulus]
MFNLRQKKKKNQKKGLMLISVTFIGSSGPMKLLVDEDEPVDSVIRTALKSYAQQQRLPVLGTNVNDFVLYCQDFDSLGPHDKVGSKGRRNFVLYEKPSSSLQQEPAGKKSSTSVTGHGRLQIWKAWMQRKEHTTSNNGVVC